MAGAQGKHNIASPVRPDGEVDWYILKMEWLTTSVSLAGLAEKYEIPQHTVRSRYYREKWSKQLKKFNTDVTEAYDKIKDSKAQEMAERLNIIDDQVVFLSQQMLDIAEEQIAELKDAETRHEKVTMAKELINTLEAGSRLLKNAQANVRLAGGKATEITENRDTKVVMDEDEKDRISNEFGFLEKKPVVKRQPLIVVDSSKSSQDSQTEGDNIRQETISP